MNKGVFWNVSTAFMKLFSSVAPISFTCSQILDAKVMIIEDYNTTYGATFLSFDQNFVLLVGKRIIGTTTANVYKYGEVVSRMAFCRSKFVNTLSDVV